MYVSQALEKTHKTIIELFKYFLQVKNFNNHEKEKEWHEFFGVNYPVNYPVK